MQSFPGRDRKTTPQPKPASGKKGMNMAAHAQEQEDRQENKVRQLLNRQIQGADDVPVVKGVDDVPIVADGEVDRSTLSKYD